MLTLKGKTPSVPAAPLRSSWKRFERITSWGGGGAKGAGKGEDEGGMGKDHLMEDQGDDEGDRQR
jgi:hypothetical protein